MPVTHYSTEEFLSTQTLAHVDETVAETFGVMLGLAALHDASQAPVQSAEEQRTGMIGFSGAMRGSCEVRMTTDAARAVASAMLAGSPIDQADEDSINDAVGEICNMLAAGWKNRTAALSGRCFLSSPTVISGRNYTVHAQNPSLTIVRRYAFDVHALEVTINCVEIAAD
jgi:chemotaxis protein CheX